MAAAIMNRCQTTITALFADFPQPDIKALYFADGREIYAVNKPLFNQSEVYAERPLAVPDVYSVGWDRVPPTSPIVISY